MGTYRPYGKKFQLFGTEDYVFYLNDISSGGSFSGNFYWADQLVSATSNAQTEPTFKKVVIGNSVSGIELTDSLGNQFGGLWHNGNALWIGAKSSSLGATPGGLFLHAGLDNSNIVNNVAYLFIRDTQAPSGASRPLVHGQGGSSTTPVYVAATGEVMTISGKITNDTFGNADTATQFADETSVALTGDVTGTATSYRGWSIATTITNGVITNAKIANPYIELANINIPLGGSVTATALKTALGLTNAVHYIGRAVNTVTDGGTQDPGITGYDINDAQLGDIILDRLGEREYIWGPNGWELLGPVDSTEAAVSYGTQNRIAYYSANNTISPAANHIYGNYTYTLSASDTSDVYFSASNSNGSVRLLASTYRGLHDPANGRWIIAIDGNATHTYVPLWANTGSLTQPIYFNGDGEPRPTSYALEATVNDATQNGIAYYSTSTEITSTAAGSNGALLEGKGASLAPTWHRSENGAVYATAQDGSLQWGTLPTAQGGTGNTSYTSDTLIYAESSTQLSSYTSTRGGPKTLWYLDDGVPTDSDETVGDGEQPVYLDNGVITETTYHLKAHIEDGTQYRAAYYSDSRVIEDAGSIYMDNSHIGINGTNTSYQFYVNGASYFNGNTTHNGIDYFANGTTYYIDNSGTGNLNALTVNNTTASTTTGTGGLIVKGGAGIAGRVTASEFNATRPMVVNAGKVYSNISGSNVILPAKTTTLFADGIAIANPGLTAANDVGWLRVTGTAETDTVLELATGDDGGNGETIHVRQYNTSNAIVNDLTLLDNKGNTQFAHGFKIYYTTIPGRAHINAAGWWKIAHVTDYFNFDIYIDGGWNTGSPSITIVNISQRNGTAVITQKSGLVGDIGSQIKLGQTATDEWDVLIYIPQFATDKNLSQQHYTFIGRRGTLTLYEPSTRDTTSYSKEVILELKPIYGSTVTTLNRTITGTTHATALQTEFNNNKTFIPRDHLLSYYSSAYGNGSQAFGYFLHGYDSNPYGGFFVAHYKQPWYVGISNGDYTQYALATSGAAMSVSQGTANRLAYYSAAGTISSGSIVTDGSYLRNIGGYNNTSYALSASSAIINSWIRTTGSTGWYNETNGGGWYMTDTSWIRMYANKQVAINSTHATSATNLSSQLVVGSVNYNGADSAGGTTAIELWRGTNASWQLANDNGTLYFRNNYTTARQTTYSKNSLILDYNTGAGSIPYLAIGQTARNTSYTLYVNGISRFNNTIHIYPALNNYREGIRIYPNGSWATFVLGGNDLTAESGTSANSWSIHNNNSNFYITRNGSTSSGTDETRSEFSSVNNQWRLRSFVQAHKAGVYRSGLHIYGPTYGNTATSMVSGTANGDIRWGDGGPQITFDTNATPGNGQVGALIFTDNDYAGEGVSFHFVTNQESDNTGGKLTVSAPRFRARKHLTIGQNSDNTSYNLYVNGTSYLKGNVDIDGITRINREKHPSDAFSTSVGITPLNIFGLKNGYPVYTDPEFASGVNSVGVYNNSGGGTVVHTRQLYSAAGIPHPGTSNGYVVTIQTKGAASPGVGGFVQAITSRANAIFVQIFRALIPVGRNVINASNSMGSNYTDRWLTSQAGTGKWEWYARIVHCGASGTFSTGGHVYLDGAAGTSSAPVTWHLAFCNLYDITKGQYDGLRVREADTASKLTDITTADVASSSATWRYVWFSYDNNKTGRPAYSSNLVFQTSTNTLKTTKFQGALIGNADTATTLQTARTINGTSFNGSANITTANWGTARNISISDSDGTNTGSAVSVNGSAAVTLKLPATIKATLTGNASTATKLSNTPNNTTTFLRGDNTWTNTLTGTFISTASPGFQNTVSAGSWSYLRLNNGSNLWDIATRSNDNSGALQFRPGGNEKVLITTAGEIITPNANAFRASYGNYGVFQRNDGSSYYFLITDSGSAKTGSWNSLRPLYFNLANGRVTMANKATITANLGVNGTNDSYNLFVHGTSYFNGAIYQKGYYYSYTSTRYHDLQLFNNASKLIGEIWFDHGDATNNTTGRYYWRQWSPTTTASSTPTSYYENYRLPEVTKDLTANVTYEIFTNKNYAFPSKGTANQLAYYSAAGTISGTPNITRGTYNISIVGNSSNAAQYIVSNGTNQISLHQAAGGNRGIYQNAGDVAGGWLLYWPNGSKEAHIVQSNLIVDAGNLYAGTTSSTTERQVHARAAAGDIYMYSQGSATGSRGIYLVAHGTGPSRGVFGVDTNNIATYYGGQLMYRTISNSTSHALALKSEFDNHKADIPRAQQISYYSTSMSNGSIAMGYFLSGYDTAPYGGFFVAHYNTPRYVGISNGTYTQWRLLKGADSGAIGGTSTPIYIDANGIAQPCTAYGSATAASATNATNATNVNIETKNATTLYFLGTTGTSNGNQRIWRNTNIYATTGNVLRGAAWNDYAEFRQSKENKEIKPGQAVYENGDDTLSISTQRLMRGCNIVSDTYGFAIGESEKAQLPIAVSGRVLAYPYESREEFKNHIGWPVCSGPNGTVSIMTEEEEMKYPSRIIGTISAVPDYEIWHGGTDIVVDGRVWIKVK